MRVHRSRLLVCASAAIALAVAMLAAGSDVSRAAMLGNFSAGPRAPTTMRSPSFGGGAGLRTEPRLQRLNDHVDHVTISDDKPGRNKGTGNGEGRHRPPKHPVRTVPIIATGVATGVAVGTGAAGAGPSGGGSTPPGGISSTRIYIPPAGETRYATDELVMEFAGNFPPLGIRDLLLRRGLVQVEAQFFTLTGSTFVRARITNGRTVPQVLQSLAGETTLRFAQPLMRFQTSEDASPAAPEAAKVTPAAVAAAAIPAGGDPAQYALAKLHLGEAHTLANGDRVLVAVIDSGIDMSHPDLAGAFAGSYDALGKAGAPHQHGTAIAGAIAAHARLMGAAPSAKILAIRAFDGSGSSAEATTTAILKGVEYATVQGARIINMSFAGPFDPSLARALAAAKGKGEVLIAASGNFGPKSPPQYPASDINVIAVSATDADDKMFPASNIGPHIAVSAPGVDILLPSPGNDYRLISGTSFAAAYVSGVVALMVQRAPALNADAVRKVLQDTAKDLGTPGKDPEYGAGLVDAYSAIMSVQPPSAAAMTPAGPAGPAEQAKAQ